MPKKLPPVRQGGGFCIVYISLPLPKRCYLWYDLHSVVWHCLLKLIQGVIDYDNCKGIAKEFDMGILPYR